VAATLFLVRLLPLVVVQAVFMARQQQQQVHLVVLVVEVVHPKMARLVLVAQHLHLVKVILGVQVVTVVAQALIPVPVVAVVHQQRVLVRLLLMVVTAETALLVLFRDHR
jgi:hypothetical protein